MIAVDSSAILAVLLSESEGPSFGATMLRQDRCLFSAVNLQETCQVILARLGDDGLRGLDGALSLFRIEVVPFSEDLARIAVVAFKKYGKGFNPASRLNLCDCAAYALAMSRGVPLLFKGDDFPHTDVASAA